MVHFFEMAQLMNDHIVTYFWGHEHQQAIEVQIRFVATATPAGLLVANCYAAILYAYLLREEGHAQGCS